MTETRIRIKIGQIIGIIFFITYLINLYLMTSNETITTVSIHVLINALTMTFINWLVIIGIILIILAIILFIISKK